MICFPSSRSKTPSLFDAPSRGRTRQTRQDAPPLGARQHSAPDALPTRAASTRLNGERPYRNKPNLGTNTYAAGARNAQIEDLGNKLKKAITPAGLYGINYGSAIGAGAATAISFAVSFLGLIVHVVPGLGVGLFVGVFLASTVIGAIVQYKARQANLGRPEVQLLSEQLAQFHAELSAIPHSERNGADVRDLRQVEALQSHMSWTFKQGLRQMGYGVLGIQPYARAEAFCDQQFRKIAALGRSKSFAAPDKAD